MSGNDVEAAADLVDKTRNARIEARYDELMRSGEHGHYETLFRIVREEIAAVELENRAYVWEVANLKAERDHAQAAIAALNVPALIQAEREACAKSLDVKTTSELEIEKAMDGEFESRKLAMAVNLICGKILAEKAAAIRARKP